VIPNELHIMIRTLFVYPSDPSIDVQIETLGLPSHR
jgi:hypothetical protein